jgi:hypothetical protein
MANAQPVTGVEVATAACAAFVGMTDELLTVAVRWVHGKAHRTPRSICGPAGRRRRACQVGKRQGPRAVAASQEAEHSGGRWVPLRDPARRVTKAVRESALGFWAPGAALGGTWAVASHARPRGATGSATGLSYAPLCGRLAPQGYSKGRVWLPVPYTVDPDLGLTQDGKIATRVPLV